MLLATQVRRSSQHGPLYYRIQRPNNITCGDMQENALRAVRLVLMLYLDCVDLSIAHVQISSLRSEMTHLG